MGAWRVFGCYGGSGRGNPQVKKAATEHGAPGRVAFLHPLSQTFPKRVVIFTLPFLSLASRSVFQGGEQRWVVGIKQDIIRDVGWVKMTKEKRGGGRPVGGSWEVGK